MEIDETALNKSTKTLLSFDQIENFLISENMEANTKLQTTLSHNLFNFLKNYLHDFYPEKETKLATQTQKASKATFKQLIRTMAGARPKFLTDFIFKSNPNIDSNTTIPFNILKNTLKKLIYKFITNLFTKLNYSTIFASELTIHSYKTKN